MALFPRRPRRQEPRRNTDREGGVWKAVLGVAQRRRREGNRTLKSELSGNARRADDGKQSLARK